MTTRSKYPLDYKNYQAPRTPLRQHLLTTFYLLVILGSYCLADLVDQWKSL